MNFVMSLAIIDYVTSRDFLCVLVFDLMLLLD